MNRARLELFEKGEHYDCSFQVRSDSGKVENIKCHKLILSMSSREFENLFYGENKVGNFTYNPNDPDDPIVLYTNLHIFKEALRFIYGRAVPVFSQDNLSSALQLLQFACEWQILPLRDLAADTCLSFELEPSMLVDLLGKFTEQNCLHHKTKIMKIIRGRVNEILPLLPQSSKANLEEILNQGSLNIFSEKDLFDCLVKWVKFHHGKEEKFKENIQHYLHLIRLKAFNNEDLADLFKETTLFSDSEKVQIFMERQASLRDKSNWRGYFQHMDTRTIDLWGGNNTLPLEAQKLKGKCFNISFSTEAMYLLAIEMDRKCFANGEEETMQISVKLVQEDGRDQPLSQIQELIKTRDKQKRVLIKFSNPCLIKYNKLYSVNVKHVSDKETIEVAMEDDSLEVYSHDNIRFEYQWTNDETFSLKYALPI